MSDKTQKNNGTTTLSPFARAAVKITDVTKKHFKIIPHKRIAFVSHNDDDIESFGVGGCGFPIHLQSKKGEQHAL